MKSGIAAFILWLCCLAGICGLHRFYLGRPWTGLLWLVTFGLLGIGQLIDLFLLRGMVREENLGRRLDVVESERLRERSGRGDLVGGRYHDHDVRDGGSW